MYSSANQPKQKKGEGKEEKKKTKESCNYIYCCNTFIIAIFAFFSTHLYIHIHICTRGSFDRRKRHNLSRSGYVSMRYCTYMTSNILESPTNATQVTRKRLPALIMSYFTTDLTIRKSANVQTRERTLPRSMHSDNTISQSFMTLRTTEKTKKIND
jgi:hypothetical protein